MSLFFKFGIRAVTMDQIAQEMGVSKKTLYEQYKNKKELVKSVLAQQLNEDQARLCICTDESENAVELMYKQCLFMRAQFKAINPVLVYELRKFFPESWELVQSFKKGFVINWIIETIDRGKEEGFFRSELDSKILSVLRYQEVDMGMREDFFDPKEFELFEIQDQLFDHFLHGILTEKGKQLYDNYKRTEFNESI